MLKCIIFDLDGVVTSTSGLHIRSWRIALQEHGLFPGDDALDRTRGVDREHSLDILLHSMDEALDADKRAKVLALKNGLYRSYLDTLDEAALFSGVEEKLVECRSSGLKLGLASASRNAVLVAYKLGVLGLFDSIGIISRVVNKKPSTEIFHVVADQLRVSASETLCVEDSAAMVASLMKEGWRVVGAGPSKRFATVKPDWTIQTITQLDLKEIAASF